MTINYRNENGRMIPLRVHTVVISTQHADGITNEFIRKELLDKIIKTTIPHHLLDKVSFFCLIQIFLCLCIRCFAGFYRDLDALLLCYCVSFISINVLLFICKGHNLSFESQRSLRDWRTSRRRRTDRPQDYRGQLRRMVREKEEKKKEEKRERER